MELPPDKIVNSSRETRIPEEPAAAGQQERLLALLRHLLRNVTLFLTIAWLAWLLILGMTLRMVGEQNVTTAALLYMPQMIWLLPLLPLMCLGLLFHRRCLLACVAALLLSGWLLLGFQWSAEVTNGAAPRGAALSIMTNNHGQSMNQSLRPFKNAMRPDVLVLQEAKGRADGYLASPDYKEFKHGVSLGEHTFLSRFPILEAVLLEASPHGNGARPARIIIDWQGTRVSVYSVHQMTPRQTLATYRRGAFLWGLLGVPGTPWAEKRRSHQDFWDRQITDACHLLTIVAADSLPAIVAGDFNAPACGYVYSLVASSLGDAHSEAGQGFGYTFPGTTSSIFSLGGPWMRIDYLFHNRRWRTVECITEPQRASQHRAVFARTMLLP